MERKKKTSDFVLSELKSVLIFEAHTDDAVIGMGGVIKKFSDNGIHVTICTATKGETQHTPENRANIVKIRMKEGLYADQILGVNQHHFLNHACQALKNDRPTFHEFVGLIRKIRPDLIFSPSPCEMHRDHRIVAELSQEAWWKATENDVLIELGKPHRAPSLLFYEVLPTFSSPPHICIDITNEWRAKIKAINCFTSQMTTLKNVMDFVEGKARIRGYLIGSAYAEAFILSNFMPRTFF
ncbi:MAG: PIG-L deacetylase family protein [Promethearchaeota archaeon]